jgi:hypothetical protein
VQESSHTTRSPRTLMQRLLCATPTPPLPENIAPHAHHLQAASAIRVDHNCPHHARALNLLYFECTGLASPGPKGGHWERLGFQGMDPATDFRAVGSLALAHLLCFFVHDETRACAVWQLSLSEPVRFTAFCLVSSSCLHRPRSASAASVLYVLVLRLCIAGWGRF